MAKKSSTAKLVVISVVVTLIILAALAFLFIRYMVPQYQITSDQLFDIAVRVFPLLIGLVLIQIGVIVGRRSEDDYKDQVDKLPPNAYTDPLFRTPTDDPKNINLDALNAIPVNEEVIKTEEVIKEVPVEVIKEVVKEVPVEVEVVKEVVKEVEVPVEVEVIKEVIKEIEVPVEVEVIKEVPVEVIKEVPVEVVREVQTELPLEVIKQIIREITEELLKNYTPPVKEEVVEDVVEEIEEELEIETPLEDELFTDTEYVEEVEDEIIEDEVVEVPQPEVVEEVEEVVVEPVLSVVTEVKMLNFKEVVEEELKDGDTSIALFSKEATIETLKGVFEEYGMIFNEENYNALVLPLYLKDEAEELVAFNKFFFNNAPYSVAAAAKGSNANKLIKEAEKNL